MTRAAPGLLLHRNWTGAPVRDMVLGAMEKRNLFSPLPGPARQEVVEVLLESPGLRLERIVSTGQATPPGEWYDQETAEWVALLSGSAWLRFEGEEELIEMHPGDWILIPPRRRHRVEQTDTDHPTIWLALYYLPTTE